MASLYAILREIFATRTMAEWVDLLLAPDICVMPVNSPETLLDDPHMRAIGFPPSRSIRPGAGSAQSGCRRNGATAGRRGQPVVVRAWLVDAEADALIRGCSEPSAVLANGTAGRPRSMDILERGAPSAGLGVRVVDPTVPSAYLSRRTVQRGQMADEKTRLHRQFDAIGRMAPASRRIIDPMLHGSLRRFRLPIAVLLVLGSFLSILPVFGLWMLPLGLMLMALDVPLLRPLVSNLLIRARRRVDVWRHRGAAD